LAKYLPAGTVEEVGRYLQQYHIHLTIAGSGKPFWAITVIARFIKIIVLA
jgi:hypothetical protein